MSLFLDSPGGTGRSDLPRKKATLTYFVRQWKPRNQPWPSTPYSGEVHLTALHTPGTVRTISASRRRPTSRFQPCRATDETGPLATLRTGPLRKEEGSIMEDWVQPTSRGELPRREVMQTPDEVAAMLRLKALGWGVRRIAGELGCSHMTVRRYVSEGGWAPQPGRRRGPKVA